MPFSLLISEDLMPDAPHILLVEDNVLDVELAFMSFDDHGWSETVTVARDGQEALDYLNRQGDFAARPASDPDLVLLDLNMPRVNGYDVLRQVKADEQLRHIPVVVLTSSNDAGDRELCIRLGADAYTVKPFNYDRFVASVGERARAWLAPGSSEPGLA